MFDILCDYLKDRTQDVELHGVKSKTRVIQSQKTQSFCVADFVILSDKRRSRSKIFLLFNTDKRTLRSKILGISQAV